jgi:NADH-quinone oxidoreductase subunit G
MIEIEIDGKKVKANKGDMVIKAADDAGIYIPRFCYHKKLSIAANCRMCLVEVENSPKTLPACATPVTEGMKVFTKSEKTVAAQKSVMEFLLINHPLDCPICDQGGECELQDLSMGYGSGVSRFNQGKRSVEDKDLGPLISSEMTRCIHCTRCVRFGDEVAGLRELGATGRGEETEIGTYIQQSITSELSGNVIDLCPVGALTNKPYRFTARAWEMQQQPAIALHDCLGSHIYVHTRGEQYSSNRNVMRVVPRENESINETWLSDRDRYSYQAVDSESRVLEPRVKTNGTWQNVEWNVALNEVVCSIQNSLTKSGKEQLGGLISSSASVEEMLLFQKWIRALGSNNVDHRLQQTDVSDQATAPLFPGLGFPIAELDNLDTCLLVGSNIRHEQPIANYRLRKAALNGAQVMAVNPTGYDANFKYSVNMVAAGTGFIKALSEIVKALSDKTGRALPAAVKSFAEAVVCSQDALNIADKLLNKKENSAVILGASANNHPQASAVRLLSGAIATLSGAKLGQLTHGANAAGAWLSGALPHRKEGGEAIIDPGLSASQMLDASLRVYVLFAVEPERDAARARVALKALKNADVVIAFTSFSGKHLEEYADIILPISTFTETKGTYVNAEGLWQKMPVIGTPKGKARSGTSVLAELLTYADKSAVDNNFDDMITGLQQVPASTITFEERAAAFDTASAHKFLIQPSDALYRVSDWPLYQTDMVVRNAQALQSTAGDKLSVVRINNGLAQKLSLNDGAVVRVAQNEKSITLPLVVDDRIPDGFVHIPAGVAETAGFGDISGEIEVSA